MWACLRLAGIKAGYVASGQVDRMTAWVGMSPMSVGPLTLSTYFLGRGRWSTVRKCQLMRQITSVGIC